MLATERTTGQRWYCLPSTQAHQTGQNREPSSWCSGCPSSRPSIEAVVGAVLTWLYLSGNQLTGCIPEGLRDIAESDLRQLNLPDCGAATPGEAATPTPERADGVCHVGLIVRPGESCSYPGTSTEFSVDSSETGRFLFFTARDRNRRPQHDQQRCHVLLRGQQARRRNLVHRGSGGFVSKAKALPRPQLGRLRRVGLRPGPADRGQGAADAVLVGGVHGRVVGRAQASAPGRRSRSSSGRSIRSARGKWSARALDRSTQREATAACAVASPCLADVCGFLRCRGISLGSHRPTHPL